MATEGCHSAPDLAASTIELMAAERRLLDVIGWAVVAVSLILVAYLVMSIVS
jgi:hypothetical protein